VVIFAVELNQLGLEVGAYASKYVAQVVDHFFGEYIAPVFGHKDQMHMHLEYTFFTEPDDVFIAHRPNYN